MTSSPPPDFDARTEEESAGAAWAALNDLFRQRARLTYSCADPDDFTVCVFTHMSGEQRDVMRTADVYQCPACQRLLKDRRSPVASSILRERERVRQLWMVVEEAMPEARDAALDVFRRGLGL